jgi:hypothetical protein
MDRKFQYRGDLSQVPLAEVLATIHRYRVPGILTLTRDARIRRIVLEEGGVAFATSNEREVSLGMYLLKTGVLNAETAREADARRSRGGLRLGQVLLQMGVLTPEKLNAAVAAQVREILWGAFDWTEGEVVFEVGAHPPVELGRMDLPIPEVILEGIRRTTDVRRLVQRLGSSATLLERTASPLISLFSPEERELYERADGKTPLQVLCGRGAGGVTENARILYAFFCLGLVRRLRANAAAAKKIHYKTEGGEIGN